MTDARGSDHPSSALEADLAVRRAQRDAEASRHELADHLAEVDLHQREARYLLERAGLLHRRRRAAG